MPNELTETTERFTQNFSAEDIKLIKETICYGATDAEFKLFLNIARTTGLNPITRQIYSISRWSAQEQKNVRTTQVSIDGFRVIAQRSREYAGQLGPWWCGSDGVWKDVWLESGPPLAAKVGVLRHGFNEPCYAVALFKSYAQTKKDGSLTHMWLTKGDIMIAKCAESLALRKTFPQELSGLYTSDEMEQATNDALQISAPPKPPERLKGTPTELEKKAKAYATELDLADTQEKFDALVLRNVDTMKELHERLPKWHTKMLARVEERAKQIAAADSGTMTSE